MASNHYMKEQFENIKERLTEEIRNLLSKNSDLFSSIMDRETEILNLAQKLRNQEVIITELTSYAAFIKRDICDQDIEIKTLNEAHLLGVTKFGKVDRAKMKFDKKYGETTSELGRELFDPEFVNAALKPNALSFYGSFV